MANKEEIRAKMVEKRRSMSSAYKSKYDKWICETLYEVIQKNNYRDVHLYLPMPGEINIYPLITSLLRDQITIVCPQALPKRQLKNRILKSLTKVEQGVFGTTHPDPNESEEFNGEYDLIIVPGLAFDSHNSRLGYGGGYYDTFLAQHPKAHKLGIFYPYQEVSSLPVESHDIALDSIVVNRNDPDTDYTQEV